jgi:putative Ca2+/H+ antiporter (TMEM165/GDT1 family)
MLPLLLTVYGTVLVAELVGDKTLYTLGALATRFRMAPILAGAAAAFMMKMAVAVLLGRLIATLPPHVVAAISATTFFVMAIGLWLKRPRPKPAEVEPPTKWHSAALISFASIFFPEWGDAGQLAAAMLAAQHRAPLVIWIGATLAMITKGAFAVTLGIGLRRFAPHRAIRVVTVLVCVIMGLLAAFQIEL